MIYIHYCQVKIFINFNKLSFPRRRESRQKLYGYWIPAFAEMTKRVFFTIAYNIYELKKLTGH